MRWKKVHFYASEKWSNVAGSTNVQNGITTLLTYYIYFTVRHEECQKGKICMPATRKQTL